MIRHKLLVVAASLSLWGCSNEQIYDTIQHNNELECSKLPQGQYEDCMAQIDQPYEEYERELEEVGESSS
ncbi:MAG: hypothetical protein Cons2KO_18030 [Congregibacter sp.]